MLHAAHGNHGRGPVDHDGIADGGGGWKSPRMRVGAERGKLATEGHDLGKRGGAVGVGEVTLLRHVHHVAAAPEVMEGVVDGDRADAVLVGEAHGLGHRAVSGGLAELAVGVPNFHKFYLEEKRITPY